MNIYLEVPTYEGGIWRTTIFHTRDEYKKFVLSCFREPGLYEFDETAFMFNEQARQFDLNGVYCTAKFKTKDYISYWDEMRERCTKGVIFHNNGRTWYLPRDYYMWINFLPIFNKEINRFGFARVRDAQYHMALYELLSELHYKHSAILKKRQIASSYFHVAKMINLYVFEEGAVIKMGASAKNYINENGSWKFLSEYHSFLTAHTAWYRPNEPDKVMSWTQRTRVTKNGRESYVGTKAAITGHTFEKDPTSGVGGPCRLFFHEEGGIAPKADTTFEFMLPALKSGMMTTGLFVIAGSVGDLSQCEPLKVFILQPDQNDIYSVTTDLLDKDGAIGQTGLFIPEQWSMPPYIDEFGNSIIHTPTPDQAKWLLSVWISDGFDPAEFDPTLGALAAILKERIQWKKDLTPEKYQLRISQKPINIEEAFAFRAISKYPQHLVSSQLARIANNEYGFELLDLEYDLNNKPVPKSTNKVPISEFPISAKTIDKEGAMVVWERPIKDAPWGTYYASIDPVGEGKTTTSESLCSIIIYKNPIERVRKEVDGTITREIEPDKIVATWCGRYDDLKKTHQKLEKMIEWYNAWTVCENNVSLFITHMVSVKKQKYLVPKDQMLFLKELKSNMSVYAEYGWKNTGTLFKQHLLNYGIEYLQEILDHDTDQDGNPVNIRFGVERIPDPMILKEMQAYGDKVNVDRLVAYSALIAFAKVQQANRSIAQVHDKPKDAVENPDLYKLPRMPFKNIGRKGAYTGAIKRSAFRNFR